MWTKGAITDRWVNGSNLSQVNYSWSHSLFPCLYTMVLFLVFHVETIWCIIIFKLRSHYRKAGKWLHVLSNAKIRAPTSYPLPVHTVCFLCYFTGQKKSDEINMTWVLGHQTGRPLYSYSDDLMHLLHSLSIAFLLLYVAEESQREPHPCPARTHRACRTTLDSNQHHPNHSRSWSTPCLVYLRPRPHYQAAHWANTDQISLQSKTHSEWVWHLEVEMTSQARKPQVNHWKPCLLVHTIKECPPGFTFSLPKCLLHTWTSEFPYTQIF